MMRQKKELTTSKKMKTAFKRRPYLKYKFMAEGDSDAPSPLCLINMSTGLQMSRVEPLKMLWQFGVVFWIQIKAENPGVAPPKKNPCSYFHLSSRLFCSKHNTITEQTRSNKLQVSFSPRHFNQLHSAQCFHFISFLCLSVGPLKYCIAFHETGPWSKKGLGSADSKDRLFECKFEAISAASVRNLPWFFPPRPPICLCAALQL